MRSAAPLRKAGAEMDHIAKLEGSNEFFARRALYNASVKLRRGDTFRAGKYLNTARTCLRAGGVSADTAQRIAALENSFLEGVA